MSARRPPTPSQWAAIRAVSAHLLVAAGAGTGKTTTVVDRILYLLGVEFEGERCPAPLALREIAAITYTTAAAADLKRKLREALRSAGLRQLAWEVDSARIGTIHSFCGDLLKEFALRAGRSPAMRVLEEGEGAALVSEAVHDAVIAAIEQGSVPGLQLLFQQADAGVIEGWVRDLAADSSRLGAIRQRLSSHTPAERALLELASLAAEQVRDRLEQAGAVDFDRMIVWTRDLLAEDAGIREAVRRRIRMLIIDEFQDVDPVQREIAYLLGDPAGRSAGTTRLMLVGDPKQSLYRFRRADVTVWRQVEDDFTLRGLGRVLPLSDNFRSLPPILGFVESTVGRLLDQPLDGTVLAPYEVPFLPVSARREEPDPAADPAVELLIPATDEDADTRADAGRAAEAAAIARRAVAIHREGTPWREMALLLPSWGPLETYQAALEEAGVPTYALRTEGFHQRREVLDLVLALQVLRDPNDDVALAGFLRSPFVGVRDETLLALARERGPSLYARLLQVECGERPLLQWAASLLEEFLPLRDRVPTAELLELVLDRTGYVAHLRLLGAEGQQAIANVRKFLRLAREQRGGGIGDFLRGLKEVRARGDRVGDERLHGARDEVVTLTSIHSAKGLEWDVVFWADLGRKDVMAEAAGLLMGRERIALKDPDAEADAQSAAYRELLAEERAETQAERKRLWYVAATRPRNRLILSGFRAGDQPKHSPAALLWPLLESVPGDPTRLAYGSENRRYGARLRHYAPAVAEVAARPAPLTPSQIELAAPPVPLAAAAGRGRHSATELMAHARCARRRWLRYVAGLREPAVERGGGPVLGAVARGSLIHDVLEHAREGLEYEEELEAAIGRWDPAAPPPDAPEGETYRAGLRGEIDAVLRDPGYVELTRAPGVQRELPFLHILGPGMALEGKMDLVSAGPEGYAIVDVKTGGPDESTARRKAEWYGPQRETYLGALAAITGRPVHRFEFKFTGTNLTVGGAVRPEEVGAAAEAVRARITAMRVGPPALTARPGDCDFCGYRTVGWCPGVSGKEA